MTQTGSWFPVAGADPESVPADLRGLWAKLAANIGFVPNVFRGYAWRPERLQAWFAHFRSLHVPSEGLSAADREMIAVVVSQVNGCLYCLVAHGSALREALGDPVLGDRMTLDWRRAGLDPRRERICSYVDKLTRAPREAGPADLDGLLEVGLSREEVWDVIEIASMYNFTNRLMMATGILPNAEYHATHR